jgi:methyl-accepting chemotaxis protein
LPSSTSVFGLFLASELRGVRDRVLNFTDSTLPSVLSVENLLYDVSYVRRAQFALLMVEDAVDQQARRGRIQESVVKVQRAMDAYEAPWGPSMSAGLQPRQASGCTIWGDQPGGCLLSQGSRDEAREALFAFNGLYTELEQAVRALVEVNLGFVEENRGSLLGSVNMVTTFAMVSIGAAAVHGGDDLVPHPPDLPAAAGRGGPGQRHRAGDLTHRLDRQHIGQTSWAMLARPPSRCRTTCVGSSRRWPPP